MKTAIIYYSYGNNTRSIAKKIGESINADLFEIEPEIPYTKDYNALVDTEEEKMDQQEIVPIKKMNIDWNKYDKVILGTPVWWYAITPPMRSFLEKNKEELNKKTCRAFITNGGWIGHSKEDIENYVPLQSYVNLEFDENTIRKNSQIELENWIKSL